MDDVTADINFSDLAAKVEEDASRIRIKDLPSDTNDKLRLELAFNVEWDDQEDGKTKSGLFRAKRPNIGMFTSIKVMEARLNSGQEQGLPTEVLKLHRYLAYCHHMLVEFPKWWTPDTFFDHEPLEKIYEHMRHWESSFRKKGVGG